MNDVENKFQKTQKSPLRINRQRPPVHTSPRLMPSNVFAGVRAYVSVTTNDNVDCSAVFSSKLSKNGAVVVKGRLTPNLTHIIFRGSKDALLALRRRADAAKCVAVIVGPAWIAASERAGSRAKESDHEVAARLTNGTPLSRWSSVDAPGSARAPGNKKRPREVERVELSRYDSDVRLMAAQAAMMDGEREEAKRTFADVARAGADDGNNKRQKTETPRLVAAVDEGNPKSRDSVRATEVASAA